MEVNVCKHAYLLCEVSGVSMIDEQDPPLQGKFSKGIPQTYLKIFCTMQKELTVNQQLLQ